MGVSVGGNGATYGSNLGGVGSGQVYNKPTEPVFFKYGPDPTLKKPENERNEPKTQDLKLIKYVSL